MNEFWHLGGGGGGALRAPYLKSKEKSQQKNVRVFAFKIMLHCQETNDFLDTFFVTYDTVYNYYMRLSYEKGPKKTDLN